MATMLETPSRIWRRIEAVEAQEMPSLPSLPPFEDTQDYEEFSDAGPIQHDDEDNFDDFMENILSPMQSTPTSSHNTVTSGFRGPSSTSSMARFAHSIISRSNRSPDNQSLRGLSLRTSQHASFEVPSLPEIQRTARMNQFSDVMDEDVKESNSISDVYLPPLDDEDEVNREFSLTDALESISRSGSPPFSPGPINYEHTPKKSYDYSVSMKSELKASPFQKYRNVAVRNRANPRARTPSLSRTSSSQTSSPAHLTPQSNRSLASVVSESAVPLSPAGLPLPRSATNSPAVIAHRPDGEEESLEAPEFSNDSHGTGARSMDITDVHVSPPRLEGEADDDRSESESELPEGGHEEEKSREMREPTFSSEGEVTPHPFGKQATQSFSSPSSLAFTPTPAFPRPQARFEVHQPPSDLIATPAPAGQEEGNTTELPDDLLTPHTRRRSFLLSVINSTARPRMKFATPHPKRIIGNNNENSMVEATPPSGTGLQTAFAGVTPRPRMVINRRPSHPLAQAIAMSDSSRKNSHTPGAQVMWATPAHSPYDGAGASFISTASSHDLTTHQRVNTSFDPAMGFGVGAPGHGVGRFNAGKLNTYLHGLNRRLQEENEALIEKLKTLEEKKGEPSGGTGKSDCRLSSGGRRSSPIATLGGVQEDVAEVWLEEKAAFEMAVEEIKADNARLQEEKEALEIEIGEEKAERERDKERWMARMGEVERGVSGIIAGLEEKVETAEKRAEEESARQIREIEKTLANTTSERDAALERVSKAESVLESGENLGGALKEANDRVAEVLGDLRQANAHIKDLKDGVIHLEGKVDELERDLGDNRNIVTGLKEDLASQAGALAAGRATVTHLQDTVQQLDEELKEAKDYVEELEDGAAEAVERIEKLEQDYAAAQEIIENMTVTERQIVQELKTLQTEAMGAREATRQMEEALEESEQKMVHDEEQMAVLRAKLSSLEREKQREANSMSRDISRAPPEAGPTEAEFQALEDELNDANREVARLTTLLSQSPARKAMEKAKDTKIEMLEREKEELLDRNRALRMTFNEMSTPSKVFPGPGISPIHRQVLNMSIRAPRTPGGPLRDISWLKTPANEQSATPLISEINRLQRELDRANDSIDDKLDKLEDAGLGVVGLTRKLEDAREKINSLEDEISRLSRKEERRLQRLSRVRCKKCNVKLDLRSLADEISVDFSKDLLPSEPPTPPTRSSEALRANLQSVNGHLEELKEQWENEKKHLLGEKAVLENATNRLNAQLKTTKEEMKKNVASNRTGERAKANLLSELGRAKQTISVLEAELSCERSRLRNMMTEQERIQREKKQIINDLKRTESDMDDVKQQLLRCKKENCEIEKELRENANIEQKVRLWESRAADNMQTIETLREERSLLATQYKELQQRYAQATETTDKLRKEYNTHLSSHDERRNELDQHRLEIEDLRHALDDRDTDLQRTEKEKEKISAEKGEVARTVAALEADLRRVRRDAENFGHDLEVLKREKENLEASSKDELAKTERSRKQAQTQIRLLNEQLDVQKDKMMRALEQLRSHVCTINTDDVTALRLQHNKECKGLIVQIRYLKAKFSRESVFRNDLAYQKQYLLVLLSQFEKSERTIFASIACIGFPVARSPSRSKVSRLKSVALMAIFLNRIKRSSESWLKESVSKKAVAAALEEVRRKRAIAAA